MTSNRNTSGKPSGTTVGSVGAQHNPSPQAEAVAHGPPGSGTEASVQGEGDYRAAERYDRSARAFVDAGKVDEAARKAKPASAEDDQAMQDAERAGLSHSKGEDPALPHASRGKQDRR